jgi:hypothetical protein
MKSTCTIPIRFFHQCGEDKKRRGTPTAKGQAEFVLLHVLETVTHFIRYVLYCMSGDFSAQTHTRRKKILEDARKWKIQGVVLKGIKREFSHLLAEKIEYLCKE